NQAFPKTFATKERTVIADTEVYYSSPRALYKDPWSKFESIAVINLDNSSVLARYKEDKGRLIYIRKLELQEHMEVSVVQILVSKLVITASEIIVIIKPDSCEIKAPEIDTAIIKLYALADIVIKLMGKCHLTHKWPVEIRNLPNQLRKRSLREILQVNAPSFL
ncbi:hypothetical protein N7490_006850, partial [Penicillium lividum]